MNLGLAFCTCKSYFGNIDNILNDLEDAEIDKNKVLFVSAQEDEDEIINYRGFEVAKVTYTGLHTTQLIYVYENMEKYPDIDYWAVLQCTNKIGKTFYTRVLEFMNAIPEPFDSVPFINPEVSLGTMDIGIVSVKLINVIRNYLKKIKLTNFNDEDLVKFKKQSIFDENITFGLDPMVPEKATRFEYEGDFIKPKYFMINSMEDIEVTDREYGGKMIKEHKLLPIDLVKYQRNYIGPDADPVLDCDGGRPQ